LTTNGSGALSWSTRIGNVVEDTTPQLGGNLDTNGNDITFGDNDKAIFGAGSDLQIYHDGSNSYIDENGTGNFNVRTINGGAISLISGNDYMATFQTDGAVTLYYDNSPKLATTSTGVDVTGGLNTTGNVGIGTSSPDTSPSTKLHIREDDAVDYKSRAVVQATDQRLVAGSHWQSGVTAYSYLQATNDAETLPNSLLLNPDGGKVGIGVTPANLLSLQSSTQYDGIKLTNGTNTVAEVVGFAAGNDAGGVKLYNGGVATAEVQASGITFFNGGNVGIGTTSPLDLVHIGEANGTATSTQLMLHNNNTGSGSAGIAFNVTATSETTSYAPKGAILFERTATSGRGAFKFMSDNVDDTNSFSADDEVMRIDSSGNLLVGKTSASGSTQGAELRSDGRMLAVSTSDFAGYFNRKSTDGEIVRFVKDTTAVGKIGSETGYTYYAGGTAGLMMRASDVIPTDGNGTKSDNAKDLGDGAYRFDDVFATNGTIQTSDANEKQQIANLTDAEITAAKAISALFKTYKWNSAVAEKGDAARTHTGVIAQEVQQALTDAGLDAGDYAFFISATWWETQTDVPAVEAVAEVLDEDGNVVTEAVEAKEAYTRTDTYDTAEEAPEGATERTRLGVRYPELLAFVGAATEQRLANIETRLAALEAN
jgi:hypothetical protein